MNTIATVFLFFSFFGIPITLIFALIQLFRGKPAKKIFFTSIGLVPILIISLIVTEFTTPNYWERQEQTYAEEQENQRIEENINKNWAEAEKAQAEYEQETHEQMADTLRTTEQIKADANTIDYDTLQQDPNLYIDEHVKFEGIVNEIRDIEDEGMGSIIALDVGNGNFVRVISLLPLENQSGDSITVYGTITEFFSYANSSGEEVTAPSLVADIIE